MRALAISLWALGWVGCGGLESPDLSTGAVEGRISPAFDGGRVYVLGSPGLRADLGKDGEFRLERVPVGPVAIVAYDGGERAGLLHVVVRGAEVTWAAPDGGSVGAPAAGGGAPAADPLPGTLPLAGGIVVRARAAEGGGVVADARFTITGTEWVDVAPDAAGEAPLWPLPPGSFGLLVRSAGYADASLAVEVRSGETATYEAQLVRVP